MILFVFEGKKTEPNLFKTIEKLYFPNNNDRKVCCFGYNIYELYKLMNESDFTEDLITVIRSKLSSQNKHSIPDDADVSDFSEIFLFFDYDFHNKNLTPEELDKQLQNMLEFFDDETDNGKLYINYPMVESIKCTNKLPDSEFVNYKATRLDCSNFKNYITFAYPFYKSTDFFMFSIDGKTKEIREPISKEKFEFVLNNWNFLKEQNIKKANFICNDKYDYPEKSDMINQQFVFKKQKENFIDKEDCVAILSSFPLFLYEYFKKNN